MKKGILGRIKEIEAIRSKIVLKNLCICLGISLSMLGGSIGIPSIGEVYSEEVEAATQFKDDKNIRDYAREAVESLVSNGGIKGYPDGTLKPSGTITRIEYLSMAMNAIDPSGSARAGVINFLKSNSDGPEFGTYYEDLNRSMSKDIQDVWGGKARDIIIISENIGAGIFDNSFTNGHSDWLQPITRAEAAEMLVACIEKLGGEELEIKDNVESIVADWKTNMSPNTPNSKYNKVVSLAVSTKDSILKLYGAGIVTGNEEGAYQPQYNLTREQAAQTIYRAVNKDKRSSVTIAPKPVEEKPVVENTTLYANDVNRRTAIAGDKFIASDGKTYDIVEQAGGIIMSETPIALDNGRYMSNSKEYVHGGCVSDGSLDGIPFGSNYCVNPDTGQGMWGYQWEALLQYYMTLLPKDGKNGDVLYYGLGNWLKIERMGELWIPSTPSWFHNM